MLGALLCKVGGSSDVMRSAGLGTSFTVRGDEGSQQTLLSSCARGRAVQWFEDDTDDAARWKPTTTTMTTTTTTTTTV
jgi:hypothetical protein